MQQTVQSAQVVWSPLFSWVQCTRAASVPGSLELSGGGSSSLGGADTHSTLLLLPPPAPFYPLSVLTTKMTSDDIKCSRNCAGKVTLTSHWGGRSSCICTVRCYSFLFLYDAFYLLLDNHLDVTIATVHDISHSRKFVILFLLLNTCLWHRIQMMPNDLWAHFKMSLLPSTPSNILATRLWHKILLLSLLLASNLLVSSELFQNKLECAPWSPWTPLTPWRGEGGIFWGRNTRYQSKTLVIISKKSCIS